MAAARRKEDHQYTCPNLTSRPHTDCHSYSFPPVRFLPIAKSRKHLAQIGDEGNEYNMQDNSRPAEWWLSGGDTPDLQGFSNLCRLRLGRRNTATV